MDGRRLFARRTMAALTLLGFSSGLPYQLSGKTLQVWLASDGVGTATVGWLALVTLPYSLKFLIAPLVDRFQPAWLGRRRGWIAAMQLLTAAAVAAMALVDPRGSLTAVAVVATCIAAASAVQDVAVDACRAESLDAREAGAGVAVFLAGYRLALLAAYAGVLVLVGDQAAAGAERRDHAWRMAYLAVAAAMAIGALGTALIREPPRPARAPTTLRDAVVRPFADLAERLGGPTLVWMLAFCVLFRLPDALAAGMTNLLLVQLGFGNRVIALVPATFGIWTTILGTIVGGSALTRLGLRRGLLLFGAAQAVSCLGYVALALRGRDLATMTAAVLVEDFCAGMVTAAFLGFLMTRCDRAYAATQYAVLTSVYAFGRTLLTAPAGAMAVRYGWPVFFAIAAASALPGLLLAARVTRGDALTSEGRA